MAMVSLGVKLEMTGWTFLSHQPGDQFSIILNIRKHIKRVNMRQSFKQPAYNCSVSNGVWIQRHCSSRWVWPGSSLASLWTRFFPLPLTIQYLFLPFSLSLHIHLIPSWPPLMGLGFNLCSDDTVLTTGEQGVVFSFIMFHWHMKTNAALSLNVHAYIILNQLTV